MPPPRTTSATSATAAIGAMCSAIRRAVLLDDRSGRGRRRARAAAKIARASYGGASVVLAPPRPTSSRGVARRPPTRTGRPPRRARQREVDLAGRAVAAAVQLAAEDEAGAEAGADREEREVVDPARDALPALTERGEVDVVLERDRQAEASRSSPPNSAPSRPATLVASVSARLGVDDARDADDDAVDQARGQPGRLERARRGGRDRLERPSASDAASSTSCRARISPAGRRSRRAGSARRGRARGRARRREPARSRRRRSSARPGRAPPRARARRRAATAARARRSASRSRPGARSRRARSARRHGSSRARCARSGP